MRDSIRFHIPPPRQSVLDPLPLPTTIEYTEYIVVEPPTFDALFKELLRREMELLKLALRPTTVLMGQDLYLCFGHLLHERYAQFMVTGEAGPHGKPTRFRGMDILCNPLMRQRGMLMLPRPDDACWHRADIQFINDYGEFRP
jgi:hypothetical protein